MTQGGMSVVKTMEIWRREISRELYIENAGPIWTFFYWGNNNERAR
jgi:hypothetical protein